MTRISVNPGQIGPRLKREIVRKLRSARLDQHLVSFAKRRIDNSGDSEEKYPELWATRLGIGYRAGGTPLRDTSILYNSLTGDSRPSSSGVNIRLIDGSGYGVKHQKGFVNKAPVFVALTRKASRVKIEVRTRKAMRFEAISKGLVEGRSGDFIVLKGDAEVPARKIYNTPPEDVHDLGEAVKAALAGV